MRNPLRVLRWQLLVLLALLCGTAWAQDYDREGRWAEQTLATLFVGDVVYLTQANGHRFLGLYTQADAPRGAVLIVHGRGWAPDFELYGALRTLLAEAGYSTLSIQMPVLPGTANIAEYLPLFGDSSERIGLALDWLQAKGDARLAIVSHSLGATMTNRYLVESQDARVRAWVFVGIINGLEGMSRIRIPVLDVFGTRDWVATRYGADERRAQISKIAGSQQVVVADAEHFFERQHAELARVITAFLARTLR
jgi:pimeloyl-ACP methyl ester carboxylesterase